MIKGQKYIDYNVSDHALFNNFHRYAYDRYYLLHASSLENAMQGYLEKTEVKDLAALTVMVKTLYKEEKMPVGLYNTWRQRFSSDQLSLLRENKQNQKEKFLNNYFPRDEDKETGQMVLDFVLCDNSIVKEVRQVCLSKKPTFSTNFFEFFINYKIPIFGLIVFIALGAGHQLGAF